jgi:ATP-dependent RNA helicase DeaD
MISFPELGIGENVLKAIEELGFKEPTPVQEQAIPVLLQNDRDFIGLAQTGTGKTAAFGLPLLELIDHKLPITQALILAPTRELCVQISKDLVNYSKYSRSINVTAVYGGASISTQIRQIKKGTQIIAATPGRLIDLIERGAVDMSSIRYVVLDEADEMLNMGFQEDIDEILSHLPKQRRVWLFSATMPQEVRTIASRYMKDPHELTIGRKNEGAGNIEHYYYVIHEKDRYQALKRVLDSVPEIFGIIFCRTKIDTQRIAESLAKDGYNSDALHGDLTQAQRDKVMARYRSHNLDVLVATDVAARGIDVNDITHVIHYNLPDEPESYTHRSGRTARAGKSGVSFTLVNVREVDKIRFIEKKINAKIHLARIPDAVQICEQQLMNLVKKIHHVKVNEQGISKYLQPVFEELQDLGKEELIKRIVSIEFNRFLDAYRHAPDLNVDLAHQGKGGHGYRNTSPRLFINLGSMDGLNESSMSQFVAQVTGISKKDIGRVDVKGVYSFIDLPEQLLKPAMDAFEGEVFQGRKVRTELSGKESTKGGSSGKKKGGWNEKRSFSDKKSGSSDKGPRSWGDKKGKSADRGSRPWSDNGAAGKNKKKKGW